MTREEGKKSQGKKKRRKKKNVVTTTQWANAEPENTRGKGKGRKRKFIHCTMENPGKSLKGNLKIQKHEAGLSKLMKCKKDPNLDRMPATDKEVWGNAGPKKSKGDQTMQRKVA